MVILGDLHFSVYKSFPCLQKNKPLDVPIGAEAGVEPKAL